jgi:hypothetical protein
MKPTLRGITHRYSLTGNRLVPRQKKERGSYFTVGEEENEV